MMKFSRTARTIRNACLALLVATGAFWAVMLKDPPKTEAAAPQITAPFSPLSLPIPANLVIHAYDTI